MLGIPASDHGVGPWVQWRLTRASIRDYVAIARPDHWFKNVLALPGVLVAALLSHSALRDFWGLLPAGAVSICLIASANYVLNEWVDASSDGFHPTKSDRPFVASSMSARITLLEYLLLASAGLAIGATISVANAVVSALFLLQGLAYNLRPLRTKDRAYLDVLSESVNNPIRLALGWFVVTDVLLPPSSLIVGYWMGGAFLMGLKRFAEYRAIGDPKLASLYRRSFETYTEHRLLISSFFYGLCSSFFLGVFMIIHRVELILSFPFFSVLFAWYLHLSMMPDSPVQSPEKLYRNKGLVVCIAGVAVVVAGLLAVDIPWLQRLIEDPFLRSTW